MAYQKGACNCQKVTNPKYPTFSKPPRLTPGKEEEKKKLRKRSVKVASQRKMLQECDNPPPMLSTNFQKSTGDTLESLHLF